MKELKRPFSSSSQNTKKIRKILNEKVKSGNISSDSEQEDVDLSKELHPLSHYIDNREEMIEQVFSIIKGPKLRRLLPPILRDTPVDELKADCLIHLLGMSAKRIKAVLEGKEVNSSSESDTHSDSSVSPSKTVKTKIVKPIVIKQEGCSDISDNSEEVVLVDPDHDDQANCNKSSINSEGKRKAKKHRKHKQNISHPEQQKKKIESKTNQEISKNDDDEQSEESEEINSESENTHETGVTEGKTLLEILELEMRARAIRALLQKSNTPEEEGGNKKDSSVDKSEPNQSTSDETIKSIKSFKENKNVSEKVTPIKNFRKKKRKSDDVIVITPKVVTIDLTEENDPKVVKNKSFNNESKHLDVGARLSSSDQESKSPGKTFQIKHSIKERHISCTTEEKDGQNDKNNPSSSELENLDKNLDPESLQKMEHKSNWAQRWLESKEVKKVVSTSKICGNIRNRIKNAKLAKLNKKDSPKAVMENTKMEGSVGEYQLLSKSSRISDCNVDVLTMDNLQSNISKPVHTTCVENEEITYVNEKSSPVEQVQDITSTKTETNKENNLKSNPKVSVEYNSNDCSSQFKNIDSTDKVELCDKNQDDEEIKSVKQNENLTIEECENDMVEHIDANIKQMELLSKIQNYEAGVNTNDNIFISDDSNSGIILIDVQKENKIDSGEIKLDTTDSENSKSELYGSNILENPQHSRCGTSISEATSDQTSYVLPSCDSSNFVNECTSLEANNLELEKQVQCTYLDRSNKTETDKTFEETNIPKEIPNEPETLEINITDEDREIDDI